MNILYLVHANYWDDYSGTPILTQEFANLAIKNNYKVCLLTPSHEKKENLFEKNKIYYLKVKALKNWSLDAFSENNIVTTEDVKLPFKPDIVHVIDWVNFDPNILNYLKKLKVPMIRHVNSFEDLCYFMHPIYYNKDNSLCEAPLNMKTCSKCISQDIYNKKKIFKKIKSLIFNEKKKDYIKIFSKISRRNNFVNIQMNEVYDHLIFGSKSFAKYFLSHVNFRNNISVVSHGIKKKKISKKDNILNRKINIIYTGGRSYRKGWSIIENSFDHLLKKYSDKINIRIYGDKKKLIKSKIGKYDSIEFYDFFEHKEIEKVISWADLAVLPTLFEPYGIIIREFLSLGVVPITTNSFGPSEIINHKINGILLNRPFVENLINEIENFITKPEIINLYREKALETKIPSKEEEFDKILKIYKSYNSH